MTKPASQSEPSLGEKDVFGVLGHELRGPLGVIDGYLDLLEKRTLGEDLGAYDEMILRARKRIEEMQTLVGDILTMARVDSGKIGRKKSKISLTNLATVCVEQQRPQAEERKISLTLHEPASLTIVGDHTELAIILSNLISNAIKYNTHGGSVEVNITPDTENHTVQIAVKDTGIGMNPVEADSVFEEFVRVHNAQTKGTPGTGLGLSIVKHLVNRAGGEIKLTTRPNSGSTFTVTLPDGSQG
jgi:two-component system phosphate regulon sensor histidine kinase PhoR